MAVLAHPHELNDIQRTQTSDTGLPVEGEKKEDSVYADNVTPLQVTDTPLKYRLIALSCILFFTTGAAFAESTLGPLKSTFVRELKINNAQFASISTASNLVNTMLPLIGGTVMDYYGSIYGAIGACFFTVLGSAIAAGAASSNNYQLLIGGRIVMGLGSIVLEICQSKLYAHWFSGSWLATVIALDLAWNSVTVVIARVSAVPMSRLGGWYGWALWIPSIVCAACTLIVIAYLVFERRVVPQRYRPITGRLATQEGVVARMRTSVLNVLRLPVFYLILAGTHLFQNSARTVYSANLTDIQERTRGTTALTGGYYSSLLNVIVIVVVPLLGMFFDKVGWRMPFVSFGAAIYVVAFALIGLTKVNAIAPILLASFGLSLNVLPWIASFPILVPDPTLIGTAYGLFSSLIACNNVILEVACGAIQDATPGQTYDRVIYVLIAIKAWQVLEGPVFDWLDGRMLGHTLRMSEKKRLKFDEEREATGQELPGLKRYRPVTIIVACQYVSMVIISWVVRFVRRDLPS
ncbi:uncharacterized protein COLE_01958 [Cutaneotrichosporon oleaginosum]|uniref:uncharacterized protein n=1 Tax=Cutaneotrichosporon oleaginosum TaxID=879819 RepID=UPI0013274030|nr:hypothetical protein COLE_01958 [Cutaneotrichosporon oleaginosum]